MREKHYARETFCHTNPLWKKNKRRRKWPEDHTFSKLRMGGLTNWSNESKKSRNVQSHQWKMCPVDLLNGTKMMKWEAAEWISAGKKKPEQANSLEQWPPTFLACDPLRISNVHLQLLVTDCSLYVQIHFFSFPSFSLSCDLLSSQYASSEVVVIPLIFPAFD